MTPLHSLLSDPHGLERLRRIHLVATDVDGTLTHAGALDPEVVHGIEALARAGIGVLPVSGRPAGEVAGLIRYLPGVTSGIAENGLVYLRPDAPPQWLVARPDRDALKRVGEQLNAEGADLRLTADEPFRLGDVAYERDKRDAETLKAMAERARQLGVYLIWSSVHVHLTPVPPDKGAAVLVLAERERLDPAGILTIGDAPNDVGLFVPNRFGLTVGTADVEAQRDSFAHLPECITAAAEGQGFMELVRALLHAHR